MQSFRRTSHLRRYLRTHVFFQRGATESPLVPNSYRWNFSFLSQLVECAFVDFHISCGLFGIENVDDFHQLTTFCASFIVACSGKARGADRGRGVPRGEGYLITLSARTSTFGGTVRQMAFAAFRLTMNSNFNGCSTGRSAGFLPFKILSTNIAARRSESRRFTP